VNGPRIYVGIGGWNFAPWRGVFYPAGLPQARELAHASRRVTSIEINGTFYRTQSPESFGKWAAETPEDFVFTVKGHRAVVNKRKLAETGDAVNWFLGSGVAELGAKLGPILWQFAPSRQFDEMDIAAFLRLLPRELAGRPLRHALEVRHASFGDPRFVALATEAGAAIVTADSDIYPEFADATGDFIYARLQRGRDDEPTCYPPSEIDLWAERAIIWLKGGEPESLVRIGETRIRSEGRDVFLFVIHNGKTRAPAGAEALIARIRR
jgi:uncharacterized protein YecE (DUF72 family)